MLSEVELDEIRRRVLEIEDVEQEKEVVDEQAEEEEVNEVIEDQSANDETEVVSLSADDTRLKEAVILWMTKIKESETQCVPPKTNRVKQGRVREEEQRINGVLGAIETEEIGETNDLILVGAMVVTERLGLKVRTRKAQKIRKPTRKELEKE